MAASGTEPADVRRDGAAAQNMAEPSGFCTGRAAMTIGACDRRGEGEEEEENDECDDGGALRIFAVVSGEPGATPMREAAAFSLRMEISSSEIPGRAEDSCTKLKGAEILRDLRWAALRLIPMSFCTRTVKPLREMHSGMAAVVSGGCCDFAWESN